MDESSSRTFYVSRILAHHSRNAMRLTKRCLRLSSNLDAYCARESFFFRWLTQQDADSF